MLVCFKVQKSDLSERERKKKTFFFFYFNRAKGKR